jgi:hypothetical protein
MKKSCIFIISNGQPCLTEILSADNRSSDRFDFLKNPIYSGPCRYCLDEAVEAFKGAVIDFSGVTVTGTCPSSLHYFCSLIIVVSTNAFQMYHFFEHRLKTLPC